MTECSSCPSEGLRRTGLHNEEWNGDSGEGDRDSGLIVISIPGRSDQASERSDAGRRILQKVITIVKEKVLPSP